MIAILDYNAGNIMSVQNALDRLNYPSIITKDVQKLINSDKIIIPGVGEASSAMRFLQVNELDTVIPQFVQPVLGICLGLQLLCESSDEGDTKCLGVFENKVKRFTGISPIPHTGWNNISVENSKLLNANMDEKDFYFVHSYYANISESTTAICGYGADFSAVLEKDNFYATQFHPEKSGDLGEIILKNFLEL